MVSGMTGTLRRCGKRRSSPSRRRQAATLVALFYKIDRPKVYLKRKLFAYVESACRSLQAADARRGGSIGPGAGPAGGNYSTRHNVSFLARPGRLFVRA